jgi:hypothetical protein
MNDLPPFRAPDLLLVVLVLAIAGGARAWYVSAAADNGSALAPLRVQAPVPRLAFAGDAALAGKDAGDRDPLVTNIKESNAFVGLAPLADSEEATAHVAPGYPWLLGFAARWLDDPGLVVRWTQCGLGALTAAFYFFFARRAFASTLVGTLAGLLCAVHPFWILNTAELADGVVATFLVGACLVLGARGSQTGGVLVSLLFGLALAGLTLVRAALLPFAVVALLWFLLRSRTLRRGWLCALLAFLGFANGLAPWMIRNYQAFHDVVPLVDSTFLHLWVSNNPKATGGPQDEQTLRAALPPDRLKQLLAEPNQARRYELLGQDVWEAVKADPAGTLRRRLWASLSFFFGEAWLRNDEAAAMRPPRQPAGGETPEAAQLPDWLGESYLAILQAALLVMVVLGLLGWRWTYGWRSEARLATFATILVPLPYILGHAGTLWGPRLPLDGVLLCYVAFAIASVLPGSGLLRER